MTGKAFINAVGKGKTDILQVFLKIFEETKSPYCIIGGLAVNAYVEPVVSLDLDIVVAMDSIEEVCNVAKGKGLRVEKFEHSVNLTSPKSDLRIQLQTDVRYQEFISRSRMKQILGYRMKVAIMEDVLQGKVWAYMDERRRMSKRQKDLADIMRLVEAYPELEKQVPNSIRKTLKLR
jgi:hypothetical protein